MERRLKYKNFDAKKVGRFIKMNLVTKMKISSLSFSSSPDSVENIFELFCLANEITDFTASPSRFSSLKRRQVFYILKKPLSS